MKSLLRKTIFGVTLENILGMFIGYIWLGFLIPPVLAILHGGHPLWAQVVGLAAIAGFIVTYVNALRVAFREVPADPPPRTAAAHVGIMLALSVLLMVMFREVGLPNLIFIVPVAVFMFAPAIGAAVALADVVLIVALALVFGNGSAAISFGVTALAVFTWTGAARYYTETSQEEKQVAMRSAVNDERDRVARDVHDVLGHSLTVISLKADLAAKLIDRDPAAAKHEIDEVAALARTAIAETRATVSGLRMRMLDDELADVITTLTDAGITVDVTGAPADVDPRGRMVFAWVLREAATNIIRHAGAEHVTVRLEPAAITVTDNGRGFDSADRRRGNGLRGLRERVEQAGGTLIVESADGGGTTITARLEAR